MIVHFGGEKWSGQEIQRAFDAAARKMEWNAGRSNFEIAFDFGQQTSLPGVAEGRIARRWGDRLTMMPLIGNARYAEIRFRINDIQPDEEAKYGIVSSEYDAIRELIDSFRSQLRRLPEVSLVP